VCVWRVEGVSACICCLANLRQKLAGDHHDHKLGVRLSRLWPLPRHTSSTCNSIDSMQYIYAVSTKVGWLA
jgi:hypothetical protein